MKIILISGGSNQGNTQIIMFFKQFLDFAEN